MTVKRRKYTSIGALSGLEGVPDGTPGWTARSQTDAMRVLRAKGVVTAAGDNGAINVWMVKDGVYSAEFQRYQRTVCADRYQSLTAIRRWLRRWWPEMQA